MTIDVLITRVVNAHNSTVYALMHADERYIANHDEFRDTVTALRQFAAKMRSRVGVLEELVERRKTATDERDKQTPDFVVEDGLRWRPTADYRLVHNLDGYCIERLWICCDDPAKAGQWRRVP